MDTRPKLTFLLLVLLIYLPQDGIHAQGPTANLSTTWTHNSSQDINYNRTFYSYFLIRFSSPRPYWPSSNLFGPPVKHYFPFAFGWYGCEDCEGYVLSIYMLHFWSTTKGDSDDLEPQVVWSANRNRPVKENSTVELTRDGDLLLKDSDESVVWSTQTAGGKSAVVGLNLTHNGNLVLHDADGAVVWQSFDHPTDSLVTGQSIVERQRLTANASPSNFTAGEFYISYSSGRFRAFVHSNPPQSYYAFWANETRKVSHQSTCHCNVNITSKALTFLVNSSSWSDRNVTLKNRSGSEPQFLRLDSHGHLRLYEWKKADGWSSTTEVMWWLPDCDYPTVCGRYGICGKYGICSKGVQCTCPLSSTTDAFRPLDSRKPSLGCYATSPLTCKSLGQHRLLRIENTTYFLWEIQRVGYEINHTTEESCKKSCLTNCTCKAAFYSYFEYPPAGWRSSCNLINEVFSLKYSPSRSSAYKQIAYIKVQEPPPSSSSNGPMIAGVTAGVVGVLLVILGISIFVYRKRRAKVEEEDEDQEMETFLPLNCTPMRFSYEDLRSSTDNFSTDKKLGSGGFGSVFEGKLPDGTKMAVKKLESIRQGKREFVSEVQTIGNIHHLNLVRLIGFCVQKSYKLLVYEYMTNGSLDKWIFPKSDGCKLSWAIRRNIICDVAKGLLYLHEECRQKIAHLDIKPQNILLDSNFNAKLADFGLAKLIDRDQSAVKTIVRGTPGYMAPEWLLSTKITEKADIYSFGIVILEIVCTRKNLDNSRPEESNHLLPVFKEKAMSDQLSDLLDERERNVQNDAVEMVKMLKLAIWCLHYIASKRPSMSMIVKVLEGIMEIPEEDLRNGFMDSTQRMELEFGAPAPSSRLLESELSCPR